MRHGEAEGLDAGGDAERALTSRGIADCRGLAAKLATTGDRWDAIICSSARRARESAEYMAGGTDLDIRDTLNLAGTDKLLATIRGLPDEVRSVLLVAHNPGVQALVLLLAGTSGGRVARRTARDFPPGALARLAFDSKNWNRLAPGTTSLRDFFTPRDSLPFPPARIFK